MKLLATGRFLTIVPASVLQFSTERTGLKVLPVEMRLPSLPAGAVTRKTFTLSPAAERFIECARKIRNELAKRR